MSKLHDCAIRLDALEMLRRHNIAHGLCPDCGGAGDVYDLRKIARTENPHATSRCRTCKGTGKPKVMR